MVIGLGLTAAHWSKFCYSDDSFPGATELFALQAFASRTNGKYMVFLTHARYLALSLLSCPSHGLKCGVGTTVCVLGCLLRSFGQRQLWSPKFPSPSSPPSLALLDSVNSVPYLGAQRPDTTRFVSLREFNYTPIMVSPF